MLEQFFTTISETNYASLKKRPPLKGVVIGAGQVGMACAYSMVIQNTLNDLLIVDKNQEKMKGEVMDLNHGLPFVEPTAVRAGTLKDSNNPDIVVITAGSKQKPGESRLDLVHRNVKIFKDLIPEVVEHCPNAILLVVTNPVDIMTYVTLKLSGLPKNRVFGSGTVLDTARFLSLLADKIKLDPRSIHAYIIGEHGDSEVPVWSKVNISGMHLFEDYLEDGNVSNSDYPKHIFEQVKNAAYEIIQRKGATCYAIGLGVTQIVQAVLRDQNQVLTVSTLLDGRYDIHDVCLSSPAVVNRQGVTRILNLELTPDEKKQLNHSAQVLHQTIESLDL
ncbi:MAG: L-lactate dehydrogenase [Coleofasciculus sp. B1-GNL1-01]|uniref:L-lactate dehydrogenase n=1 Tax=Coleofasciculus sp. B1-GNL1-01 TaxID=3068484 RepID=UPI0032FA5E17